MDHAAQERAYFILMCALVGGFMISSIMCLLAVEYRRWQRFMNEQREYFRKLAHRQLESARKAKMMTDQKKKLFSRRNMLAEQQISVADAKPGTMIAGDVIDSQGRVLLTAGETLTRDNIERLRARGIKHLLV